MVLHGYERTGIKENKKLKENKEQMLKRKRREETSNHKRENHL